MVKPISKTTSELLVNVIGLKQQLDLIKKKLDIAVTQLEKTRDYIEGCRYQKTNYFLIDSKDVSIIFNETNEALEQIKDKEQQWLHF